MNYISLQGRTDLTVSRLEPLIDETVDGLTVAVPGHVDIDMTQVVFKCRDLIGEWRARLVQGEKSYFDKFGGWPQ